MGGKKARKHLSESIILIMGHGTLSVFTRAGGRSVVCHLFVEA